MNAPLILVADDETEFANAIFQGVVAETDAQFVVRHPRDITLGNIRSAAVVVVDHYLEDWIELDAQLPAMSPRNGFALAAVLRSHLPTEIPGPAITILTGHLEMLAGDLPLASAQHLLAWQHDVEWVFPKSAPNLVEQLLSLAEGVSKLRSAWTPPINLTDLTSNWLALPEVEWKGVAQDHVFQARPPIHAVGAETKGSSVLRWFLQRVWPYPAFLIDIHWTATRLGVTVEWLRTELQSRSEFSALLDGCAYSGAFGGFGEPRWWRAGVANAIAEMSSGQPFDRDAVNDGIARLCSGKPEFLIEDRPMVAVDPNTMEATQVIDARAGVQICPDGWPVYADSVWANVDDVFSDPSLMDIVENPSNLPQG